MPPNRSTRRSAGFLWLATAFGWAIWMLMMGTEPNPQENWLSSMFGDKVLHAGSFVLGGVLWIHSIRRVGRLRFLAAVVWGGLISFIFGVFVEVFQRAIPGREPELGDLIADLIGISIAIGLYTLASKIFHKEAIKRERNVN